MPERGWSEKDERKYQHIKEGELERGRAEERAKEIAARTVNKERREEGRTPAKRTEGTGNPNLTYEERSREELEKIARERGVEGYTGKTKEELIRILRS